MPVYAPCPISTCFAMTVTLESEPIRRKALGVKPPPATGAAGAPNARPVAPPNSNPIVSATAPRDPALLRKSRRVARGLARVLLLMGYTLTESAAAWMAARIREWGAQRQMLPLMALSV